MSSANHADSSVAFRSATRREPRGSWRRPPISVGRGWRGPQARTDRRFPECAGHTARTQPHLAGDRGPRRSRWLLHRCRRRLGRGPSQQPRPESEGGRSTRLFDLSVPGTGQRRGCRPARDARRRAYKSCRLPPQHLASHARRDRQVRPVRETEVELRRSADPYPASSRPPGSRARVSSLMTAVAHCRSSSVAIGVRSLTRIELMPARSRAATARIVALPSDPRFGLNIRPMCSPSRLSPPVDLARSLGQHLASTERRCERYQEQVCSWLEYGRTL